MRRQKDNVQSDGTRLKKKFIKRLYDTTEGFEKAILEIKQEADNFHGVWRMYTSVNARSVDKAFKTLQIAIINGEVDPLRVNDKWMRILQQPGSKGESKWLIDIDTRDYKIQERIRVKIKETGATILSEYGTPSGIHIITDRGFAPTVLSDEEFADIKPDDMQFLEMFEVK